MNLHCHCKKDTVCNEKEGAKTEAKWFLQGSQLLPEGISGIKHNGRAKKQDLLSTSSFRLQFTGQGLGYS